MMGAQTNVHSAKPQWDPLPQNLIQPPGALLAYNIHLWRGKGNSFFAPAQLKTIMSHVKGKTTRFSGRTSSNVWQFPIGTLRRPVALDRSTRHAHIVTITGTSYRQRKRKLSFAAVTCPADGRPI